jgi:hypothetical protein
MHIFVSWCLYQATIGCHGIQRPCTTFSEKTLGSPRDCEPFARRPLLDGSAEPKGSKGSLALVPVDTWGQIQRKIHGNEKSTINGDLSGKIIYKWWIFYGYVSLLKGIFNRKIMESIGNHSQMHRTDFL